MTLRIPFFRHHIQVSCTVRKLSTRNGAMQNVRKASILDNETAAEDLKDKDNSDVLFHDVGSTGLITLNRPHAMNALKVPMCLRMIYTLGGWECEKKRVLIEGAGDKAFCAGGDLTLIKYAGTADFDFQRRKIFGTFYKLFYLIRTYKIPIIALMDNVTMGNGAGVSVHAKYRIVTDKSVFAMPEASLGFSPDGGCSYIFPRLQGKLGLFLGLTGYRLKGADILRSGIASHYVPSESLPKLKQELLNSPDKCLDSIIREFESTNLSDESLFLPYMEKINDYFSDPTIEEILDRLEADGSVWAKEIVKTLSSMSPTSLKIFHELYRRGKNLSFSECLKMEFRVSYSLVNSKSDFYKVVMAMTSKDKIPEWFPASLKDVKEEDVLRRFEPLHPDKELQL